MSKEYSDIWVLFSFFFGGGGRGRGEGWSVRRSQNLEIVVFSVKKKLHTALRSVQFLASFISFQFEILSNLACGEKKFRPVSKNSVKLGEKSTTCSDF